jgi:hypothetical protein
MAGLRRLARGKDAAKDDLRQMLRWFYDREMKSDWVGADRVLAQAFAAYGDDYDPIIQRQLHAAETVKRSRTGEAYDVAPSGLNPGDQLEVNGKLLTVRQVIHNTVDLFGNPTVQVVFETGEVVPYRTDGDLIVDGKRNQGRGYDEDRRARLHRALDAVLGDEAEFKESDHPRQEDGKFGSKAVTATRGHVERKSAYSAGSMEDRANHIEKELGCNARAAKKYARATAVYSGSGYYAVRSGEDKHTAAVLQNYVDAAPKWDGNGPLYRGMGLRPAQIAELQPGAVVDMKGLSSWSSDSSVADGFAKRHGHGHVQRVVFEVDKGDTATSIAHLSESATEDEVLFSGTTKFEVVDTSFKTTKRPYDKGPAYRIQVFKVREVPV